PNCTNAAPGPAASGRLPMDVAESGSAQPASVTGAEPEGWNTVDFTVANANVAGFASHGTTTAGNPAGCTGVFLFQCSFTVEPYAVALESATASNAALPALNEMVTFDGGWKTAPA